MFDVDLLSSVPTKSDKQFTIEKILSSKKVEDNVLTFPRVHPWE